MVEERVQRRLAAILVADVVGYSRQIEADEEGTRARLRNLHRRPQTTAERFSPWSESGSGRHGQKSLLLARNQSSGAGKSLPLPPQLRTYFPQ